MEKLVVWAKSHPWIAGVAVVIGGLFFLMIMRGGSSSSNASGPDANLSAYLAAETQQNLQDNSLAAAMSTNAAQTEQARIATQGQVDINNTWAATNLATTEANNATSTQNSLISYFGQLANNLGTVLTNSSSSGYSSSSAGSQGFLWGLFGSSGASQSGSYSGSSSQSFVANSQQAAAEHELEQIANQQFHVGS